MVWEIYFVEMHRVEYWTTRQCNKFFGKGEFLELTQGHPPHISAFKIPLSEVDPDEYKKSQNMIKDYLRGPKV